MRGLIFLTDMFPFGIKETFIENEITYLAEEFDKIYVLPLGLTIDTSFIRPLPQNVEVVFPSKTDYLYKNQNPSTIQRVIWTLRYMLPWIIKCFFSKIFYKEIKMLIKTNNVNLPVIKGVIRDLAPIERNKLHYQKKLSQIDFSKYEELIVYSYWFNAFACFIKKWNTNIFNGKINKIVSRAHGIDLYDERRISKYIPFRSEMLQIIDKLYCISEDGYNYIKKKYPDYENKFQISYLGTIDRGYKEYQRKSTKFTIVSCSSIIPVKRVNLIVDALSLLGESNINWIHFGEGKDYEYIKDYAKNKLNIMYSFMGQRGNNEVLEYYKNNQIDLFINVSESEGLPVSIMEAMSFGIPIIATDVGGTSEAVINGKNGFLLKKEFTIFELVKAIKCIIEMNDKEYTKMRNNSRMIWEKKFNADKNYKKFLEQILED